MQPKYSGVAKLATACGRDGNKLWTDWQHFVANPSTNPVLPSSALYFSGT